MNWEAIGAIGETLGAMAVVVSLVYLAIQIRIQNRESRISTINGLTEQWNALLASIAQDEELSSTWAQGLRGAEFDEPEEVRFRAIANSYLHIMEGLYLQHIDGRFDDRLWSGVDGSLTDLLPAPGIRRFWSGRRHWYSLEFQAFVETRMAELGESDGALYEVSRGHRSDA